MDKTGDKNFLFLQCTFGVLLLYLSVFFLLYLKLKLQIVMKTSQKKGIAKLIFKHTTTMEHFFTKKVAFPLRSVVLAC